MVKKELMGMIERDRKRAQLKAPFCIKCGTKTIDMGLNGYYCKTCGKFIT